MVDANKKIQKLIEESLTELQRKELEEKIKSLSPEERESLTHLTGQLKNAFPSAVSGAVGGVIGGVGGGLHSGGVPAAVIDGLLWGTAGAIGSGLKDFNDAREMAKIIEKQKSIKD